MLKGARKKGDEEYDQMLRKLNSVSMAIEQSFVEIMEDGKLRPQKRRMFAQEIETAAGDTNIVWLTLDKKYSFGAKLRPWSFGFAFDTLELVEKGAKIRKQGDFLHDYARIMAENIAQIKPGYKTHSDLDKAWKDYDKLLTRTEKMKCEKGFRKEATAFREENEISGAEAIEFLESLPKQHLRLPELVFEGELPISLAKKVYFRGDEYDMGGVKELLS